MSARVQKNFRMSFIGVLSLLGVFALSWSLQAFSKEKSHSGRSTASTKRGLASLSLFSVYRDQRFPNLLPGTASSPILGKSCLFSCSSGEEAHGLGVKSQTSPADSSHFTDSGFATSLRESPFYSPYLSEVWRIQIKPN